MTLESALSPEAPRGGKRPGGILAVGCFGMATYAMSSVILSATLEPLSVEFQRNLAECGVLLLFAPLGFIVCTLTSGWLSDRWGQRVFLLGGFAALALGMGMIALTRSYAAVMAGLFLVGVSGGFVESPLSAVTADAFPRRRVKVLNFLQIFFNVGACSGPALVALLLRSGWGWRSGFGAMTAFAVAALAASAAMMPGRPRAASDTSASAAKGEVKWGIVLVMAAAIFLYVGGELSIAQWSAKFLVAVHGVSDARAALVITGFWFGMMLGRALYVIFVERWGYLIPLLLSAVLAGAATGGLAFCPSALAAAIGVGSAGFFLAGSWPTILAYAGHRSPGRTGAVYGVLVAAGAAGWLVIPPMAGWVAEHSGLGLRAALLVGAASLLAEGAVILGIVIGERRHASR